MGRGHAGCHGAIRGARDDDDHRGSQCVAREQFTRAAATIEALGHSREAVLQPVQRAVRPRAQGDGVVPGVGMVEQGWTVGHTATRDPKPPYQGV